MMARGELFVASGDCPPDIPARTARRPPDAGQTSDVEESRGPAGSRNASRSAPPNNHQPAPAGDAQPSSARARVALSDQVEEVAREIRMRERVYPDWVAKARLKPETADRKLADLRAAHATLVYMAAHAEGLRALIRFLKDHLRDAGAPPTAEEAAALVRQPAVRTLLDAIPGAEIAAVRPLPRPTRDGPAAGDPEEEHP